MMMEFALLCAILTGFFCTTRLASWVQRYSPPQSTAQPRFQTIDGLRGYLALAVVAHHFVIWRGIVFLGRSWAAPEPNWQNQLGAGAVALFFMTTGFLFYPVIERGTSIPAWIAFVIKRFCRLVPLTMFSVGLVAVVLALQFQVLPTPGFVKEVVYWVTGWNQATLLGIPGAGRANGLVLWSLWYEWVFYLLLLPVFATAVRSAQGKLPAWLVPVLIVVVALVFRSGGSEDPVWRYLPLFAVGMLAREIFAVRQIRNLLQRRSMAVCAALALMVGMLAFETPYGWALPFFAFFFVTVACGNKLFGLVSTSGAFALGDASFGIYLLHGLILYLWFQLAPPLQDGWLFMASLPLLMCFSALLAIFCYRWIERPAIAAGAKLAAKADEILQAATRQSDSQKNAAVQKNDAAPDKKS